MAKREKTDYKGVYWYEVNVPGGKQGKAPKREKCFLVIFRRPGNRKQFEEVLGTASQGWTAARASLERAELIKGKLTKAEMAEEEAQQAAAAAVSAAASAKERFTVNDAWRAYSENRKVSPQDRSRYRLYIETHCGDMAVSDLEPTTLTQLRKKVEDKGLSPQTVKHVQTLVRRMLNWCAEQKKCSIPTDLKFDIPEFSNVKEEHLTEEELAALLSELKKKQAGHPVGCGLVQLAVFTGLRPIQMTHLKWTDIDFENGRITVRKKGNVANATETIPINDMALEVLQRLERVNEWVFPSRRGGPLVNYRKAVGKALEDINLPAGFRPLYGLRHNFASWVANLPNADLILLKEMMTHSDLRTTLRYAHLFDARKKKSTQQLGRKFKKSMLEHEKKKKNEERSEE